MIQSNATPTANNSYTQYEFAKAGIITPQMDPRRAA